MKTGAKTDIGQVRKLNEDSLNVVITDSYTYAIVADGMGGHLAGEVASSMAVNIITEYIDKNIKPEMDRFQVKEIIHRAFKKANEDIYQYSCDNDSAMGMGTTTTLCMVRDGYIIYAHVGDSRAYVFTDKAEQITRDHSFVQELVKLGEITPEEAKHHPRRNYITRAMGVENIVRIDTGVRPYAGEDILLCSDGLIGEIEDKELFEAVKKYEPTECAEYLVDLANQRGGSDNITVIVLKGENTDE